MIYIEKYVSNGIFPVHTFYVFIGLIMCVNICFHALSFAMLIIIGFEMKLNFVYLHLFHSIIFFL